MPQILAIDLGTSGPKVALFSARGELLAHAVASTATHWLAGGGAEQSPDEWWLAIRQAVGELTAQRPEAIEQIAAICCTGQWSGTVPVGADGRALANAITWQDARGAAQVRAVTGGWPAVSGYGLRRLLTWVRLTGGLPTSSGKDSIAHILYLKEREPELYARTHKFLEPKDYLNLRLTGRFAATYDSITLHWVTDNRDLERVVYLDRLLEWVGVPRDKLPELIRATDIAGPLNEEAARELRLPAGVPVIGGTPDIHSAAVGSGAVEDFAAHLYLGTSSWLVCHVPFKKTDLLHNMASLPSALPGRYLLINEQESAGACVDYLLDRVLFADDTLGTGERPADIYRRFDELAGSAPPGSNRLLFLPWLNGERTPVDQHQVRGGFLNQSLRSSRADMARAVLEGVAYNTRWLLDYVERFAGRPMPEIRIIGGGARSALWRQIMADVLNRPILAVDDPLHVNSRGAALLAGLALGYLRAEEIPRLVQVTERHEPMGENRRIYDEMYAAFRESFRRNQSLFARLNR
jgi:xylulokinase